MQTNTRSGFVLQDEPGGAMMDAHSAWNQTAHYETLVDTIFLIFNCTVLTLTLALGVPGNLWVCWVVFRTKSLQTCNNALLVSLAVSDLLKCSVDTPLLLFSFLSYGEDSQVSVSVCTLQQFTYALCSCVQLLTLVSISVERFQAIAFPFQTERRRARVQVWILSIWACGLLLAVISLTLSKKALLYMMCRPHVAAAKDVRFRDPFGPYVLVPVWGLSLTVIVIHYVRIFKVVRQHRNKVFSRGVKLRPRVSEHVWGWMKVPVSAPRTAPPDSLGSLSDVGSCSPMPSRRTVLLVAEASAPCAGPSTGGSLERPPEIVGAVCLLKPGARERGKKQMEGKLAKRFGYIIIAFTLFWVPMVVILLMNVISWQDTDKLLMELETSAMVLTCMQAAVDPLIYTLVTRQFRSELSKILSSISGCPLKLRA
ncbi:D(2) dopamine receptor-like [Notolabrus celidotus]|uniref:D(2) dopamine receptor-like n=1 Tax=Notolabrus celidotus TaxID=1203425 RepID=UPI00149053BA|nr:D(2) dopamine receptor-like [Notolabrus celidotus]